MENVQSDFWYVSVAIFTQHDELHSDVIYNDIICTVDIRPTKDECLGIKCIRKCDSDSRIQQGGKKKEKFLETGRDATQAAAWHKPKALSLHCLDFYWGDMG